MRPSPADGVAAGLPWALSVSFLPPWVPAHHVHATGVSLSIWVLVSGVCLFLFLFLLQ